jgi:hypothetical protein
MAFWALNIEALGKNHPVFGFDILGLSRSSRPAFSNDPLQIEEVREKWYGKLNIKQSYVIIRSLFFQLKNGERP